MLGAIAFDASDATDIRADSDAEPPNDLTEEVEPGTCATDVRLNAVWGIDAALGFFHDFSGLLLFMIA